QERGLLVAADCVSSVAIVPVDLGDVHLASTASGKGIGSLPGLSIVFHRGHLQPAPSLPRYMDLSLYSRADGVPFTHSSTLIRALGVAAQRTVMRGRFADVERLTPWLRRELRQRGYVLIAPESA